MKIPEIQIDIGLLWGETEITGEITGDFEIRITDASGKSARIENTSRDFRARAISSCKEPTFGIRLEESLSEVRARDILKNALSISQSFRGEIVEAGVKWSDELDGRVRWPILHAGSLHDAEEFLDELRSNTSLEPLSLAIVQMTDRSDAPFEISTNNEKREVTRVSFVPRGQNSLFYLRDIPIGRGFHWERHERLGYRGELHLHASRAGGITAMNRLPLETYIRSTVFSEMGPDLPDAFVAAQAIAARSTVLATANRHHHGEGFHLCNDDHCQCYQGVLREPQVISSALAKTEGEILAFDGKPVDARYAKCCGGVSETYEAVWGGEGPSYFAARACGEFETADLTQDRNVREFLSKKPPAFCNDGLHPYPERWREENYFRWQREYGASELQTLIEAKVGMEVGTLRELRAIKRGASGRILILEIVGSKRSLRIYRELEIRRALSLSHLPSSCFIVEPEGKGPDKFRLIGAGWGHGVGLCQLGAAAMAQKDWNKERILEHYYPGTSLVSSTWQ
jgi:SpoIID/LytB domain protein